MSASTAIGMVSESIRNLLVAEMKLQPPVNVTILGPDESGDERRINLFLYKVQENPFLKNADWQVKPGSPGVLMPPPLPLNLFYLMTPYAKNDAQMGNTTVHEILGEAMRVLHENQIVSELHLVDGLKGAREQIKITQNTLDMEELARVWGTFTQPFRLSVLYQVSVVQIDALPARERQMAPRVREIGLPRVQAPFRPPTLNDLDKAFVSGTAGRTITLRGKNMTGWRAYVTVSDAKSERQILNGSALAQDSFDVLLPDDLAVGFHELRADISHLYRRTFFIEVTA